MWASYELWDAPHRYDWLRQVEDCKGNHIITHNSKLKSRKREGLTEFCFRSPLSSVFYRTGLYQYPYLISPFRTSRLVGCSFFFFVDKIHKNVLLLC